MMNGCPLKSPQEIYDSYFRKISLNYLFEQSAVSQLAMIREVKYMLRGSHSQTQGNIVGSDDNDTIITDDKTIILDNGPIHNTPIQTVNEKIEDEQNQQAKAPKPKLNNDQLAKKRAYDRERQKTCFEKRKKTIADSLKESNAMINAYEASATHVIDKVSAKDQAYKRFIEMVAKVQAFANESENNNKYVQTCLSNMPCDLSAAHRQELIQRVNKTPLVSAFSNHQSNSLFSRVMEGAKPGQTEKVEQAENRNLVQKFQ